MNPTQAVHPGTPTLSGVMPKSPAPDDPRVVRALEEYAAALKSGSRPDRHEFQARYPEIAAALAEGLEGLEFVQAAAPHLQQPDVGRPAAASGTPSDFQPEGSLGDYRILGEVGRGGMGVVYKAVQISLDRQVALKVLPFAATLDAKQLQRFKNEAQAAAHLHHQNIVPVYGVGCERGVHYYAMQFIDGQTLAALIHELRQSSGVPPAAQVAVPSRAASLAGELAAGRWVPAKQAVTSGGEQTGPYTMATAEPATLPAAGLSTEQSTKKPTFFRTVANLGVQAAEALEHAHGLGVIHRDIKPANLLVDLRGKLWITDFGLAHCQSQAGLTMTGDLVGTLRYMSPEQALAQRVAIDHRTDVYSLGATLYELLTLEPVFDGRDRQELLRQLAFEEPRPLRRLNRAIPAELETIVLKAIEKNPNERYATAQELADDLERFLKDEPILAKRPSLFQRTGRWCRRHRTVVWAAAAVLLIAAAALAGSTGWIVRDQEARQAVTEPLVNDTLAQAKSSLREGKLPEARSTLRRAEGLLEGGGGSAELRRRVRELQMDLAMLAKLEEIRLQQTELKDGGFDDASADPAYAHAFREYGIDVEELAATEAAERMRARGIGVKLAAAVDDWAMVCRGARKEDDQTWKHLLTVARAADPDPWRNQMREALELGQPIVLEKLAASDQVTALAPSTFVLLANALAANRSYDKAVACLRAARQQHPDDFWINYTLAWYLMGRNPPQWDEAIRYCTAAVSLRPNSPGAHVNLGVALREGGSVDEAIAAHQGAICLKPDYAEAYSNLGIALLDKGQLDAAVAAFREAIRLKPNLVAAHCNLGNALVYKGQLDAAVAACREAIRLKPNLAEAHNNLGRALLDKGQLDAAVAAWREAIRLKPNLADAHNNLGMALRDKGQQDAAVAAFREAIRLKPNLAAAHNNLGSALRDKGQLDAAIVVYQKAVGVNPNNPEAHYSLGTALLEKGQLDVAIAAFDKTVHLKPDYPEAHCNLGLALRRKGQFTEALAALRRGHELGSKDRKWPYPSAQWVRECERLVALDDKLPAILKGEVAPAGAAECIELAAQCALKRLHRAATQCYEKAFASQPNLAEDPRLGHRYNAACSAALAGCRKGKDAEALTDKEQARLRQQALDWLRDDLSAWRQLMEKEPDKIRSLVRQQLQHWQQDADFVGVRGSDALSRLPEPERLGWQHLWDEVEALRKSAAGSP